MRLLLCKHQRLLHILPVVIHLLLDLQLIESSDEERVYSLELGGPAALA